MLSRSSATRRINDCRTRPTSTTGPAIAYAHLCVPRIRSSLSTPTPRDAGRARIASRLLLLASTTVSAHLPLVIDVSCSPRRQSLRRYYRNNSSPPVPCVIVARTGGFRYEPAVPESHFRSSSTSPARLVDVLCEDLTTTMEQKYGIKRLGPAQYILGIQIKRQTDKSIILSQEAYVASILRRFGMSDSSPASTPMAPNRQLEHSLAEPSKTARTRYMQAIGCLLYAATGTRPNISYAVGYLARFSASPTPKHWTANKTVFWYLRGTACLGLHYSSEQGKFSDFTGNSDADWGTCTTLSRSTC
ncbi:BZ3500_MvSof-1268-A1-R1_Chr3-2g06216 [Microbotryum saponariae]|uniref:BZ3500_MvSof-1268-A1-R1_Chr3-2g06216 protein n=1 Tax=Microbotryum saponariae TaxID=289078 RepID=A0A2X0KVI1_9BASI|nr:BZ3500_MvSof-1268-A1-R1_Chr3-2g06216 [Microbotryum saponariae]SDA04132.1 BZ3501_MvSof-1269-A2-R1_Chr3-2g05907 [Microbotryum saponariae]